LALLAACVWALLAVAPLPASASYGDVGGTIRNVLPPGQAGGLPATAQSTNQLPLYDGLTPLRGRVGAGDVERYYKSERFGSPYMAGRVEDTPRPGVRIVRDEPYGVPHIFGLSRSDVMWGAGWVTAEDRGLLIQVVRGPARLAALDAPGFDFLSAVTSLQGFESSAATERFLSRQVDRLVAEGGRAGRKVLKDTRNYVAGINAWYEANLPAGSRPPEFTVNDVEASAAAIGAVFGNGGGDEVRRSDFLARLQQRLGTRRGLAVWRDLAEADDPGAPTTVSRPFPYGTPAPRSAPGSPVIDAGSISPEGISAARVRARARRAMSNALLLGGTRSKSGRPLAVMGPQVGYSYPGLLMELDLHGPGIDARGASFPGVSLYVLLGRGPNYAWSATSAGSDNTDQFLERLCEPNGGTPTRSSRYYVYRGSCRAMTTFNAGRFTGPGGSEVVFRQTVHGPVSGTVTVGGRPYAIATLRSTRGREGASALGFRQLNGGVRNARDFLRAASNIEFTFNWFYADARNIAYFSSGRLPVRARGVDPGLPTLGDGRYEWRGILPASRHPQAIDPPAGFLTSWNNKPAPRFRASDSEWSYGSIYRSQMLRPRAGRLTLPGAVATMNRAATEDLRATRVWPSIARVLGGAAPDARTRRAAQLVSAWARRGASRLDTDLDGKIDDPGAAIIDVAWPRLADADLRRVLGPLLDPLAALISRDNPPSPIGSAFQTGWYGYLDKDLRTIAGKRVRGRFSRRYCGKGDVARCRADLWAALKVATDALAAAQGDDPDAWRADARPERITFIPGLLPDTMRWTNRPTFQQVIEFARR
jgi:acyl-homoserine lactone acylase PvdQ